MGRVGEGVGYGGGNVEIGLAWAGGILLQSERRSESAFMNRSALRSMVVALFLALMIVPASVVAQEPGNVPETKAPAPTPKAAATAPSAWEIEHDKQMKEDWPWLARFREDNMKLGMPAAGDNRVVFMGDSITEAWKLEDSFPGKPFVNRGISGQTTPQMVLRFRQDVIALQPKVVVILAGINDIAGNTGPETLTQIEDNIASMAELANAHHIGVVLCSVLPAFDFPWQPGMTPAPKVLTLNTWIKAYAVDHGAVYVDYHTPMKDARDGLPATLSHDGVHPTPAGYAVMAPLAAAGIEKALGQ